MIFILKETRRNICIDTQIFKEKYSQPFFMLEGLFEKHPYIIPIAQQMAKYPNEFWHMVMVAQVYESVLGSLFEKDYLARKNLGFYDLGTLGALLHDIGKFGVDPGGIDRSLVIMNYVPKNRNDTLVSNGKIARLGQNLRPEWIRATQNLHPLIGGYMINLMGEMGIMPKRIVDIVASPAFEHHETDDSGFKTSYPRSIRRLEDPNKTFIDLLVQLADAAVSMREKRLYRDKLSFSEIEIELDFNLQDSRLLQHIGSIMNLSNQDSMQTNDLRKTLVKEVLASISSIDSIIRDLPDLSLLKWNSIEESNFGDRFMLETLIAQAWRNKDKNEDKKQNRRERILDTLKNYLETDYYHLTRSNLQE